MSAVVERRPGVQFEQYVTESRERLYRFAVVLCGDPVLAGDLVTEVLGLAFDAGTLAFVGFVPVDYKTGKQNHQAEIIRKTGVVKATGDRL